jgi:methionine synthase II (cobalamin-independent)
MKKSKEILLVGSVPLSDAEAVFRMLASRLNGYAKRYPDGETGHRTNWIRWQRAAFERHPAFELEVADPTIAGIKDAQSRPIFRIKDPGANLEFGPLGYAQEAISSYATFDRLKRAGEIAKDTRFQVSMPTAMALVSSFVSFQDRGTAEPAIELALKRETDEISSAIPHRELAIQWDAVMEIVGHDGGYPLHYSDTLANGVSRICRHVDFVPADVEVGLHLCYGDPGHKHIIEPTSLRTSVEFTNGIGAGSKRDVTWVHMPVPRDRMDTGYYEPLSELRLRPTVEVYLGLVHQHGGLVATRQRIELAERFFENFGIASECGFGRRPPETVPDLLDLHRQAAEPSPATV